MIGICVILAGLLPVESPLDRPVECDHCGVKWASIESTIVRLMTSPRPHDREMAAQALGKVNWICHPEAVHALTDALRSDPKDDVREEAALALGAMKACDPEAHFALRKAAVADRDLGVRKKSRKSLAMLPHRCIDDCVVCGPRPAAPSKRLLSDGSYVVSGSERVVDIPGPTVLESTEPAPVRRPQAVLPPEDVPPPPPTPVVVPPVNRSTQIPPPLLPLASEVPIRRSSAKPVLPPLEGPAR